MEKVRRELIRRIEVATDQFEAEYEAMQHFFDIETWHIEEIAIKRKTNNAEEKAIAEIREALAEEGITGVEVIDPPYNPLNPWDNIIPYKALTLADENWLDYR